MPRHLELLQVAGHCIKFGGLAAWGAAEAGWAPDFYYGCPLAILRPLVALTSVGGICESFFTSLSPLSLLPANLAHRHL